MRYDIGLQKAVAQNLASIRAEIILLGKNIRLADRYTTRMMDQRADILLQVLCKIYAWL